MREVGSSGFLRRDLHGKVSEVAKLCERSRTRNWPSVRNPTSYVGVEKVNSCCYEMSFASGLKMR